MRVTIDSLARRAVTLLAVGCGTAVLFYACNDKSNPIGTGANTCTTPTTTFTVGGAGGGGNGAGGLGGSGALGGGGTAAGGAGGGGSGGGVIPPDDPCYIDGAFSTAGMAFFSPTPPDLAAALDHLTFAYMASPRAITVVLQASHGPDDSFLGLGATEDLGNGQAFPTGMAPVFVPALMGYGTFRTATPQGMAWLRVVDDNGSVDIELDNISLEAKTDNQCASIWATLDAVIPSSQEWTTLTIDGVTATLGDLAQGVGGAGGAGGSGGGGPVPSSWPMRAVFQAEAVNFDFNSL
jgi:hypothetical protein